LPCRTKRHLRVRLRGHAPAFTIPFAYTLAWFNPALLSCCDVSAKLVVKMGAIYSNIL